MDSFFLVTRTENMGEMNMGTRTLTQEGPARGNPNTFFSSLLEFCVDSVTACLSSDTDKLCVPVALSCLSALLLLLSCSLLVCQRCRSRGSKPGETSIFIYSLLGNLCSTVGAILSRQLHILILMGAFAAAVDAIHCLSCCFPVLLYWNSKAERRRRMLRGRRRQRLLAVCVLMVVAWGFLKSRVTHRLADRPVGGRRLLHVTLRDNTEILGYILGLLSCVIAGTSRFPALCRAWKGQLLTRNYMVSGLLCSLAGALYAAAILRYDTRFEFLLRVMPWLLSAICCVTLDLLTLMTEMGHYMDVSAQPARKICLKDIVSSKEEVTGRPLNRTVRTGLDSLCPSDTSYDSSLVSSDLEVGRTTQVKSIK